MFDYDFYSTHLCFSRRGRTQRPWLPWATQWRLNLPGWRRGRLTQSWVDTPRWWLLRTAFRTLCQKVGKKLHGEKKQLSIIKSWHLREERTSNLSNVITSFFTRVFSSFGGCAVFLFSDNAIASYAAQIDCWFEKVSLELVSDSDSSPTKLARIVGTVAYFC